MRPALFCGLLALAWPALRADIPRPLRGDAHGVICLEVENADSLQGWEQKRYYTGVALLAKDAQGSAEYRLRITTPGTYRVHLLGARAASPAVAADVIALALAPDGDDFGAPFLVRLPDSHATAWSDLDADGRPGASVVIPAPGLWRLRISAAHGVGFTLDKLVLASRGYLPSGTGPEETRSPDVDVAKGGFDPLVVLPPAWAFGVLYGGYTDQSQTLDAVGKLAAGDFPIDAYWIDSWFWNFQNQGLGPDGYMSFQEDKTAFPDVPGFWRELQKRHIKAGVWIWDCILREGNEAAFDEFEKANLFSDIFISRDRWHNNPGMAICGNIDFDNPAAVAHWHKKLAPFFAAGLDFLKIDRNSAVNFSKAAFEAAQQLGRETRGRGFILAHLHSTHDPRFKLYPTKWTGDAKIAWDQPGYPDFGVAAMGALRENIWMVADPKRSTYEVPFLAHDAGGYNTFASTTYTMSFDRGKVSDELYTRWLQFSALNTVTTLFSSQANPTRNHPYAFTPRTQDIVRHYLHLRMRLFPYLYTAALDTRLTGRKPVQGDRVHEDQYLLGPNLLVAPVYVAGATQRDVFLPEGRWYEWGSDRVHEGGRTIVADAPLERMPLFVRAGAIVPLRDYAASIEAGTNDHLTLEVWPAAAASAYTLREDDGTSNDYLTGGFASTTLRLSPEAGGCTLEILPVEGQYTNMAPVRQWTVRLHDQPTARKVRLDGRNLDPRHDPVTRILTVEFSGEKTAAHRLTVE
jgi:alpha-glucosidase (family GH31 glycosyl hydrolase)